MPPQNGTDEVGLLRREVRELRQELAEAARMARDVGSSNHLDIRLMAQRIDRLEVEVRDLHTSSTKDSQELAVLKIKSRDNTLVTTTNTASSWQFMGIAIAAFLSLAGSILTALLK